MLKHLQIKANVQLDRTYVVLRYLKHGRRKRLPDSPDTYLIYLGKHIEKEVLKQPTIFAVSKITERACIYKENDRMPFLLNEDVPWVPLRVSYVFLNDDDDDDDDDKNLISYLA